LLVVWSSIGLCVVGWVGLWVQIFTLRWVGLGQSFGGLGWVGWKKLDPMTTLMWTDAGSDEPLCPYRPSNTTTTFQ